MTEHDRRYPLLWPEDQARTEPNLRRYGSRYKVSQDAAQSALAHELQLMDAQHVVISTNIQLRRDGLPYARQRAPEDPGVAVYWTTKGGVDVCIACDLFHGIRDNMRAIGLSIAALRSIERAGATQVLDRAYRGFAQLPASTLMPRPWREVLGAEPNCSIERARFLYLQLTREHHPDHGGDEARMAGINEAWAAAKRELR